ncbi:MAG: hypothetical protein AVDCRST_MAG49-3291 [uncultured Thermomicrobiales bacterium]|uniref:Uncharacterized protein n=1 Tax=uncultured Thermomicrobiales bacterium TaxID=1645740 RepID=A0A6J4V362_9BACT|nr:MAG: hypothetical protein AVDCRST_MAG49-3291 [uncultured Thermomicrobiales bacterium]
MGTAGGPGRGQRQADRRVRVALVGRRLGAVPQVRRLAQQLVDQRWLDPVGDRVAVGGRRLDRLGRPADRRLGPGVGADGPVARRAVRLRGCPRLRRSGRGRRLVLGAPDPDRGDGGEPPAHRAGERGPPSDRPTRHPVLVHRCPPSSGRDQVAVSVRSRATVGLRGRSVVGSAPGQGTGRRPERAGLVGRVAPGPGRRRCRPAPAPPAAGPTTSARSGSPRLGRFPSPTRRWSRR